MKGHSFLSHNSRVFNEVQIQGAVIGSRVLTHIVFFPSSKNFLTLDLTGTLQMTAFEFHVTEFNEDNDFHSANVNTD